MRLLDLFCGAGGAAVGYSRAGFDVVGVDCQPQPRYPFEFHQADAMTYPLDGFDVIHASPPCQRYTWAAARWRNETNDYPDLLGATRARLRGRRFVIENVIGAGVILPLAFTLCGSMFGLGVKRHRLFECSDLIWVPDHPPCTIATAEWTRRCTVAGHGGDGPHYSFDVWQQSMGIDWMTRAELTQAIPPAYTEYIGRQIYGHTSESHQIALGRSTDGDQRSDAGS